LSGDENGALRRATSFPVGRLIEADRTVSEEKFSPVKSKIERIAANGMETDFPAKLKNNLGKWIETPDQTSKVQVHF
jgi:hypothetical protein